MLATRLATVFRHRKENKKKCTLEPFKKKGEWNFFTYPKDILTVPENTIVLSLSGPVLTKKDRLSHLLLIDGTWRYAEKMERLTHAIHDLPRRSLPSQVKTAYPRKQEDCLKPESGLSSIEAIYTAYEILGWENDSLLENYPFKQRFLEINEDFFRQIS